MSAHQPVSSLFLMYGSSFELICTKFGMWHLYILRTVVWVSERRSSARARAPHA